MFYLPPLLIFSGNSMDFFSVFSISFETFLVYPVFKIGVSTVDLSTTISRLILGLGLLLFDS
jgi:hypothetical protein